MKYYMHLSYCALTACVILFATQQGLAKVEFDSTQLMMKNAEQVSSMVMKKVRKAQEIQTKQEDSDDGTIQAEPEALDLLKDAMRIAMSRPDQDGARANMFAQVRRELSDLNALDEVLLALAKEGVAGSKSSSASTRLQATYITLLDNMLAEIKPEVSSNATFKKIVELIRDAKIDVPEKVRQQSLLRSMSRPTSPSESAAKILPKK